MELYLALAILHLVSGTYCQYEATWSSLDNRPLPEWYDEAKVGIFVHWGVYAVPGRGEWFWSNWKIVKDPGSSSFMNSFYKPNFTYQDFGPAFTARYFNATVWADLFRRSGAKYAYSMIIITLLFVAVWADVCRAMNAIPREPNSEVCVLLKRS